LQNVFRFTRFEADRDRHQLRNGTRRIKLERIPLELLFLLLEYDGNLVTREQIVERLWGTDLLLDTERSINTAVRKVRRALRDDPHKPQFIETVIGKGYRFVAPVIQERPNSRKFDPSPHTTAALDCANTKASDIWLRAFSIDVNEDKPVLSCEVVVGGVSLGRIPMVKLTLPLDLSMPLKPGDQLLLSLRGLDLTLTSNATQVLHALSMSLLQSSIRLDVPSPSLRVNDESKRWAPDIGNRDLPPPAGAEGSAVPQQP
jgi:DNA-binding winged helix-turn-helix (wHTH) protein